MTTASPLREVATNARLSRGPAELKAAALDMDALPIGVPTPNPFETRPAAASKPNGAKAKKRAPAPASADAPDAPPAPNIEDMPVGGGSSAPMPDEYPPGYVPPEEGADEASLAALPLEKRLASKRWQERKSAYDELAALADADADGVRAQYEPTLKTMVADANPFAQERALELVVTLAKALRTPDDAARLAAAVTAALCERCLTGRPNVRARAVEAALLCAQAGGGLATQAMAMQLTAHKVPKVALAALELIVAQITSCGLGALELKTLVKPLGALADAHKDKAVREAALCCLVELRARAGDGVVASALKDAKAVVLAEFDRLYAERKAGAPPPPPPRAPCATAGRDGAAPSAAAPPAAGASSVVGSYEEAAVEVSALAQLPKGWAAKLGAAKWQERKEALDALCAALDVRLLKRSDDYGEVMRALKRLIPADSNVNVVAAAVRAVGLLARGLGAELRGVKELGALLLEKAAEKNRAVHDALGGALDALVHGGGAQVPADVVEWAAAGLASKTPAVRLAATDLLRRTAEVAKPPAPPLPLPTARAYVGALLGATDDGAAEVRSGAFAALAACLVGAGEPGGGARERLDGLLKELDAVKRKALDRALAANGGGGGSAAAQQPARPSAEPSQARPATAAAAERPAAAASARPSTAKPKAAKTGTAALAKPAAAATATKPAAASSFGFTAADLEPSAHSAAPLAGEADADARLRALLGEGAAERVLGGLSAKAWKERADAVDALAAALVDPAAPPSAREPLTVDAAAALLGRSPGWADTNALVGARMAVAMGALARACGPALPRAVVLRAALPLAERLADAKAGAGAADALGALAACAGAPLVCALVARAARGAKNPKLAQEACVWLRAAALQHGGPIGGAPGVAEMLAEAMAHRDGKARDAAVAAAVALERVEREGRSGEGPLLRALLPKLPPQAAAALAAALNKAAAEPLPAALSARLAATAAGAARGARAADADGIAPAGGRALAPLVLEPAVLAGLGSAQWKARHAALGDARAALAAATADGARGVEPSSAVPLCEALRKVLADTNRTVAALGAELAGELAAGLGAAASALCKPLAPALLALLADARPAAREAASAALGKLIAASSVEPLLPLARAALSNESGRAHVLALLATYAPVVKAAGCLAELRLLLPHAAAALAAERAPAGGHADRLFAALLAHLGTAAVRGARAELKPAEQAALDAALARHGDGAAAGAAAPAAAAVAAAAPNEANEVELGADDDAEAATEALTTQAAARAASPPAYLAAPAAAAAPKPPPAAAAAAAKPVAPPPAKAIAEPAAPPPAAAASAGLFAPSAKGKERRAKEEAKLRWLHAAEAAPSAEAVALLREQFGSVAAAPFVAQLFAADFRDHLAALGALDAELERALDADGRLLRPAASCALAQAVDLLARWLALRLCASANSAVVLRCAAFAERLLGALGASAVQLSELEARALLPALCAQLGANAEPLRVRFRLLVRKACDVCAPAAVGGALLDLLAASRNAKARVECLEMLGWLASAHGAAAVTPARALPLATSHAGAADQRTRTAATELGRIASHADAERKPQAQPAVAPPQPPQPAVADALVAPPTPPRAAHAAPLSRMPQPLGRAQQQAAAPAAPAAPAARPPLSPLRPASALASVRPAAHLSASPLLAPAVVAPPPPPSTPSARLCALAAALYRHGLQDESARVGAVRDLAAEMKTAAEAELRAHASALFDALFACLRAALPADGCGVSARWCKHLLNALMDLVKVPAAGRTLSSACARGGVLTLLSGLILVHGAEATIAEGSRMLRALNLLVLRFLDELPRTRLVTTLLGLVADAPAPELCALLLKSMDKATAALAAAKPADGAAADLDARAVLGAVGALLRAREEDAPGAGGLSSPAPSPSGAGGVLGRRARDAARSLAREALRVGGLTVAEACEGLPAADALLLSRCLAHGGAPATTPRVSPATAKPSAQSGESPSGAGAPSTPLARALADATSVGLAAAVGAPPSSARRARARSAAKAPLSAAKHAAVAPSPAQSRLLAVLGATADDLKPTADGAGASPAPPEASRRAEADAPLAPADDAAAGAAAWNALAAGGSSSDSMQARVERIQQLRARFPGSAAPLAARERDASASAAAVGCVSPPGDCMQRVLELKRQYHDRLHGDAAAAPQPARAEGGDQLAPSHSAMAAKLLERVARMKAEVGQCPAAGQTEQ